MNKYTADQRYVADLLCKILCAAYPSVNPEAINIIAKNAVVSADMATRCYWMQTGTGAMIGEAMATIAVTDALLPNYHYEEIEL